MSSSPATDTTTTSARCSVCTVRDIQDLQLSGERYSTRPGWRRRHPAPAERPDRDEQRSRPDRGARGDVTLCGMVTSSKPDLRQHRRIRTELMERIRTGIIGDGQLFE